MDETMKKKILFLPFLAFALWYTSCACTSCAAQINGALKGNGQADLQIRTALEPRMTALITGFAAASGAAQPGALLLDGPAIAASLSAAPGVASASFKNTSPAAIEGPVKIAQISEFLAPGKAQFITFEQKASGGQCTITLSRDTSPEILALISPEVSDYLSALMAPIVTGETLTGAQYLMAIGSVYGRGIADEIEKATIRASIEFPGSVQSAKGGTVSGKRANYAIPLLDILVLEDPISYEVVWR
ncbi:MAG: hypothetical protein FWF55_05725 [Treponema sp.]|nr:hypothetical protein [Treponema sp.]